MRSRPVTLFKLKFGYYSNIPGQKQPRRVASPENVKVEEKTGVPAFQTEEKRVMIIISIVLE